MIFGNVYLVDFFTCYDAAAAYAAVVTLTKKDQVFIQDSTSNISTI